MKKLISILLIVAMLALALTACGKKSKKKTTTPATPPAQTTTGGSVDPWEQAATSVKAMDANLRSIIISMSEAVNANVKNKEYVEGPASREGASDIQGFIYDRNQDAYSKLGMTVRYKYTDWEWNFARGNIVSVCQATYDENSPDLFVDLMYDMVGAALAGVFREVTTINGSYFNFESEGWYGDIMSDLSFDRERLYLLAGDYWLDAMRNMVVMPYNLSLLDTSTGDADLVAAITGKDTWSDRDENGDKQYLSDFLFQIVRDGKWTYDKLTEIASAIYVDSDAVPGDSEGDSPLGLLLDYRQGIMSSAFLYSSGVQCLGESTDGDGKLVMTYPATGDEINKVFKATDKMISASGTLIIKGKNNADAYAQIRSTFASGKAFAIGAEVLGSFESDEFTHMNHTFSVLPLPLLEEDPNGTIDSYSTPIHNCAAVAAINIKSPKFLPISAFVQYCTEHELTQMVRHEYLQIIMKYDLVEYNAGTDEMLEIAYNSLRDCREMIVDNIVYQQNGVGTELRWHGILKFNQFLEKDFLSKYESVRSTKQSVLDKLLKTWRTLPTQAPSAE